MKNTGVLFRIFLVMLTFAFCHEICAQKHPNRPNTGKIKTMFGGGDINLNDSIEAYRTLMDNIPVDPDFLYEPRFAIVGKDGAFYFSVGANLKFTTSYDWGNPVDDPGGLRVSAITKARPGDDQAFQMTAQSSNLYFNIVGFPSSANRVGFFVSFAMDGEPGNTYKLHSGHVYMRFRNFTFGYTSSMYNDKSADPYTIDGHGPCASGSHDNIQINYQRYLSRNIRVGASLELPKVSYTSYIPANKDESFDSSPIRQRVPDFPMYITYAIDNDRHIRLSTVLRSVTYRDYVAGQNRNLFGWGVKFTGSGRRGPLVYYLMAQTGKGIQSYLQDNQDLCLDLVPDDNRPGRLKKPFSWGGIVGLQYNFTDKLFASAVYSYMRNYVDRYTGNATNDYCDLFKYGNYALGNLIWQVSPLFRVGVEYVYGQKAVFSGTKLSNNRVYAMLMMSF